MAEQVRLKWNKGGFRQILLSDGCHQVVQEVTEEIQMRANDNNERGGEGFRANTQVGGYGGGRWIGFVSSTDKASKIAESEDKALTRAVK